MRYHHRARFHAPHVERIGLELAYCLDAGRLLRGSFATWCPTGIGKETLVALGGRSWAIENAQTVKTEFGLDHNETRPSMAGTDTVRRLDGAGEFCLNRLGVSNKSATQWSVSASAAQRLRRRIAARFATNRFAVLERGDSHIIWTIRVTQ
jgi:hypothetical protein